MKSHLPGGETKMSLRFVIGRAGTGKSELCLREIGKKQEETQGNLIYIVPEQFSLEAEKKLLEKTSSGGMIQAQVLSFRRLAFPVFAEKGGGGKTLLSEIGKSMILRKVLLEQGKNLEYFKRAVDKQGFLQQIAMTISEMYQYNMTQDKLDVFAKNASEQSIVHAKIRDLKLIYDGYLDFISKDYLSSDETLDVLAEKMEGASLLKEAEVWLDGFYGFTPQELKVISRLLSDTKRVTVTLTMDRKSFENPNLSMVSPFFEPAQTAKKLIQLAGEKGIKIESPLFLTEPLRYQTEEMKTLEEQYFYSHPHGCIKTEQIKIFAAANRYAEAEQAAAEILILARDKGFRYRDIAVVSRGIQHYEKELKGIFQEYGIPYFIDTKREVVSHPLMELVRSAVEILARDFSYESVFRYLRTNLTGMDRNDIDELENYVLAYGIKSYKWRAEEWNYGFKKRPDEEKKAKMNRLRDEFLAPFQAAFPDMGKMKKASVREWCQRICSLLEQIQAAERISDWIAVMEQEGRLEKGREQKQIWNILMDILQKMVEILGEERISIEEYGKILEAGISESDMGMIPLGVDQILIGDLERSRLPEIKALFILGVNDGILPAPIEEQGIFTEQERTELEKMGAELGHSSKRKMFEEQYLIYGGISKPSHAIFFSYSLGDLNGKAMRPSILIGKLKKIFPGLKEIQEEEKNPLDYITRPIPTLHKLGDTLRRYQEGEDTEEIWKDAAGFYRSREEWKSRFALMEWGMTNRNEEPRLNPLTLKKMYGKEFHTSVSRLEQFNSCPYSYFVQYGLKAKERPLYQVNRPDLGTLFHGVLELFSRKLEQENRSWRTLSKEETEYRMEQAVDQIAPELGSEILLSTSGYQYLVRRLKRISKRAVWTLTEHIKKGSFEPLEFELGFGKNEKLPPIVIVLSNGERMILEGKIDRVDIWDKEGKRYVKIIDYKSGNKEFNLLDIYYGMQLQLMLYLDAFLKTDAFLEGESLFPGGVFYFKINDPMVTSTVHLSAEQVEALLRKELKMSGLVLLDQEVLKAMDSDFSGQSGEISEIIPVGMTSKGELKADSSVADLKLYQKIMDYTQRKAKEIGDQITEGVIDISPYRKKKTIPCQFCDFKPICRFDPSAKESKYRRIKSLSKEEIIEKIQKQQE